MTPRTKELFNQACLMAFAGICVSIVAPIAGKFVAALGTPESRAQLQSIGTVLGFSLAFLVVLTGLNLPILYFRARRSELDGAGGPFGAAKMMLALVTSVAAWSSLICFVSAARLIAG